MGKHGTQQHRRFDSPAYGTLDRAKLGLPDPDPVVERDALRPTLEDVDEADLGRQLLLRAALRRGHTDVAGADHGDLLLGDG